MPFYVPNPHPITENPPITSSSTTDIGNLVELDSLKWENEFAAFDMAKTEQSKDNQEASISHNEEGLLNQAKGLDEKFDAVWDNITTENALNDAFGSDIDDYNEAFFNSNSILREDGKPDLGQYTFEPENYYRGQPHLNQVLESLIEDKTSSNLSLAILALEAEIQQSTEASLDSATWNKLGQLQAQNEKELPAIRALEQALKLDPHNLEALQSLAVSYTNEGYEIAVALTLSRWLGTKYPELHQSVTIEGKSYKELHDEVAHAFLRAA